MSSATTVSIYIPRMLGNIRKKTIVDAFYELNIGYTKKIDMFHRRNNYNHEYYFSFITLQLFNTDDAAEFYKKLLSLGKLNYCINALKQKGLIKIENFKRNKNKINYFYILTAKGITKKLNLTLVFMKKKMLEYEELKNELDKKNGF